MEPESSTSPIRFLPADSDILLITFGGMAHLQKIPFEFQRVTQGLPVKHLAVRDLRQLWYQAGLPGISENVWGTVEYLQQFINIEKPMRIMTLGSSMGGYAALLFGHQLDADVSITFAPKTIIDPVWRILHGDYWFWRSQLQLLRRWRFFNPTWNLRSAFLSANKDICCHLYFDSEHRIDRLHAYNLAGFANVHFFEASGAGHNFVKHMADQGLLREIIEKAIADFRFYP